MNGADSRARTLRRGAALAGLAVVLWGFGVFVPLPAIVALRWTAPRTTAFIEARRARLRSQGKPSAIDRRPVPLSAVSPALVRAVLAAEDSRFFDHHGIDWEAVQDARAYNLRHARDKRPRVRGASTITQQLAKNLFLSPDRSLVRKVREAAIAVTMELVLPKPKILEHYLSSIEWGERVYGCEAAARTLFGVPASRLSPSAAATMAAMIPNPVWYRAHPERLARRAARIALRALLKAPPAAEPEEDEAPVEDPSAR